jgi:hypothetical protein
MAINRPPPNIQSPAPTVPDVAAPARPPAGGDLTSYIEARRRARAQSAPEASAESVANAPPAEDDKARSDRIVAANLGTQRAQTFGYDPTQGGGVFQLVRMGYDNAEFNFFGWSCARSSPSFASTSRRTSTGNRIAWAAPSRCPPARATTQASRNSCCANSLTTRACRSNAGRGGLRLLVRCSGCGRLDQHVRDRVGHF